MRLRGGLIGDAPGWRTLFQQEGFPCEVLSSPDQIQQDRLSVLVAHDRLPPGWAGAVKEFVGKGGALVATGKIVAPLFGWKEGRRWLRYLLPQPDSPFHGVGLTDVHATGVFPERAQWCPGDGGNPSILIERFADGIVLALPVDLGALVVDSRVRRKRFYSEGRRQPAEEVSLVSKGEIRKIFHHALRIVHTDRGQPYCHLWYFPEGAPSVFGFRVDTDHGSREEVDALQRSAGTKNVRMSWFVHVEAHRDWLKKFQETKDQEIGVHCYSHSLHKSYATSRADLQRALEALAGLSPVGSAAPYGQWSEDAARAVEELGFLYSSEFSFDYDNLPSFPRIGGQSSGVLQVPIHPICIGSFRRCHSTDAEMIRYFDQVIEWKLAAGEPLFFYHHPKDGHPAVLGHVMDRLHATRVPNLLFHEFASWWKKRLEWKTEMEVSEGVISVDGMWNSGGCLRIIRNGEEAIVPLSRKIPMNGIRWTQVRAGRPLPTDIERIRRFSPRLVFEDIQTSWRKRFR